MSNEWEKKILELVSEYQHYIKSAQYTKARYTMQAIKIMKEEAQDNGRNDGKHELDTGVATTGSGS